VGNELFGTSWSRITEPPKAEATKTPEAEATEGINSEE